jgi:hypothetical protein
VNGRSGEEEAERRLMELEYSGPYMRGGGGEAVDGVGVLVGG